MVFRYQYSVVEDGYGEVNVFISFADNFNDLFATTNVIEIDFIKPGKISKELDAEGGSVNNEFDFTIDGSELIKNTDFYNFITGNNANKFVNVCINAVAPGNMLFLGVVQNNYELNDYVWNSNNWSGNINAISEFKMKAKPFATDVVSRYSMSELIDSLSNTWKQQNVSNKISYYYKYHNGYTYRTELLELVQLDVVLKELANILAAKISSDYAPITITLNSVNLPFALHPARWQCWQYEDEDTILHYTRFVPGYLEEAFKIYNDDFYPARLEFDNPSSNVAPIYVNARLLYSMPNEPDGNKAKADRWTRYKDYFEFIKEIAKSFGLAVKFEFSSSNNLVISFLGSNEIGQNEVFIKDVTRSRLTVTDKEQNESDEIQARASYFANEGAKHYVITPKANKYVYDAVEEVKTSDKMLPLSISPSVALYDFWIGDKLPYETGSAGVYNKEAGIPHNIGFYDANASAPKLATYGITSAMFIRVGIHQSDPHKSFQTEPYYTHVAALRVKHGTEDKIFYTLADYVKFRLNKQQNYYLYERELEVPGFMQFSSSSSGTPLQWNALELGRKVTINSKSYIVTNIEYDFESHSVNIKLNTSDMFAFEAPTTAFPGTIEPQTTSVTSIKNNVIIERYKAGQAIAQYEAVAIDTNSYAMRALSHSTHFNKIIGIALNSANALDWVFVQRNGTVKTPSGFPSLTEGQLVYCRLNPDVYPSQPNVNINPLTSINAYENMYVQLGRAIDSTHYEIDIKNYLLE